MIKLLIALTAMLFVGCSTSQLLCPLETTANASLATELNTLGGCSNTSAITAQLQAWESPLNLCPASDKAKSGLISDVCDGLIPIVEAAANNEKYLSAWGCDLTKVSSLTALLTQACGALSPAAKPAPIVTPIPKKISAKKAKKKHWYSFLPGL